MVTMKDEMVKLRNDLEEAKQIIDQKGAEKAAVDYTQQTTEKEINEMKVKVNEFANDIQKTMSMSNMNIESLKVLEAKLEMNTGEELNKLKDNIRQLEARFAAQMNLTCLNVFNGSVRKLTTYDAITYAIRSGCNDQGSDHGHHSAPGLNNH